MQKLEKTFACPVCMQVLADPVILTCSHNMCLQCAKFLISVTCLRENQKNLISCPVCRHHTFVPNYSVESLTRNLLIKNYLEELKTMRPASHDSELCQLCYQSPRKATCECLSCEAEVCDECASAHLQKEKFQHHKIVQLDQHGQAALCPEHLREHEYYCMNDRVLACTYCIHYSRTHRDHEVLPLAEARLRLAEDVARARDSISTTMKTLEGTLDQYTAFLQGLEKSEEELKSKVSATCQALGSKVEETKTRAIAEVRSHYATYRQEVESQLKLVTDARAVAQDIQQTSDDLVFVGRAERLQTVRVNTCVPAAPEISIAFPNHGLLDTLLKDCCQIKILTEAEDVPRHLVYLSRGSSDYILYDFETDTYESKKIVFDQIIPRWSGFAVLNDGSVLITGGKENKETGAKNNAFLLRLNSGETQTLLSMLNGHSSHISLLVGKQVFVLGGKNQANNTHNCCEVYSLQTQAWTAIAPMNFGRTCASGVHYAGRIYVLGGYQASVDNSIEEYTLSSDSWELLSLRLPEKLWQHSSLLISPNQVLIFGGECPSDEAHRMSYIYDLENQTFYGFVPIPIRHNWLFFWLQVVKRGHCVYAMNKEKQVLKYSVPNNSWVIFKA